MKLQYGELNPNTRQVVTTRAIKEYASLDDAIRQEFFKEGFVADQSEIDSIIAGFVETDTAFICDADESLIYFVKH